ncbi:hypothetical protein FH972_025649 [Carpinus fangiana]|uniref:Uncharacterized protein n=1 Tax=Carpinus fangiana TaxID=176857 RepID=A0A5N6L1M6_9ROSI|nr:hypothetical protein FH972_025649 [Carpinus fangiana]
MPQLAHRAIVPTQESPNLPSENNNAFTSLVVYTTVAFGYPIERTRTITGIRTASTSKAYSMSTSSRGQSATSARASTPTARVPALPLTTLVTSRGIAGQTTIVGSIIPLTMTDNSGRHVGSGIANARTTVPLAAAVTEPVTPDQTSATRSATGTPSSNQNDTSGGISPGGIAAAVVVPVIVIILGAILAFFLIRRRRRQQRVQTPSGLSETGSSSTATEAGTDNAIITEKKNQHTAPFITTHTQNNYNTGLDSAGTSTVSSGPGIPRTARVAANGTTPPYLRNPHGSSTMSNPFTDGSGASSRNIGSDAFAGFSGAATETGSTGHTTRGTNSSSRAVSPVREVDTPAGGREVDDEDASEISDAEYHDAEVQVARAHMGRAHRASVITMRGMGDDGSSRGGSPTSGNPIKDV